MSSSIAWTHSSIQSTSSASTICQDEITIMEKKHPDFQEKSFQELEEMKQAALNDGNDISIEISAYIELRKKDNTSYVLFQIKNWLESGIQEVVQNYNENLIAIKKERKTNQDAILNQYQIAIQKLKENHSIEIGGLNNQKSIEIERASSRSTSEIRSLLAQSQKFATNNNTTQATKLKNEALKLQNQQIQKVKSEINQKYEKLIQQVDQKFSKNKQQLKDKCDFDNQTNENAKIAEIDEQKRKLSVCINNMQQRALNQGCQELVAKNKRKFFSKEVTKFVLKTVSGLGKGFIFDD